MDENLEDAAATLTRIVRRAGRVVDEAELPEALRAHAFERTLDLLLAEAGLGAPVEERSPLPRPPRDVLAAADAVAPVGAAGPEGPLDRIARKAGIAAEAAKGVYRLEHDGVSLVVADRRLDRNKATGARQITLLVAGGRQAAGFEEWTNLAHAREVCAVYNRLDSKNYAATVKSMADVFNFHGQGIRREVRLTMPGWDEWADLVRRLAAGADPVLR